jgi:hypothetical protein
MIEIAGEVPDMRSPQGGAQRKLLDAAGDAAS